jgi:hypothetical protein
MIPGWCPRGIGIGIVVAGQRTVSLVEHYENSVAALLPDGVAHDPIDEPPCLIIAALDVIVVRVRRAAAGRERVAETVHGTALIGHDTRERGHLLAAEVAEQLLERGLLGELLWIVLNLSDYGNGLCFTPYSLAVLLSPGQLARGVPDSGMFCRYARQSLPASTNWPASEGRFTRRRWIEGLTGGP